jgi:hypothetical protein
MFSGWYGAKYTVLVNIIFCVMVMDSVSDPIQNQWVLRIRNKKEAGQYASRKRKVEDMFMF